MITASHCKRALSTERRVQFPVIFLCSTTKIQTNTKTR